MLLLNYLSKYSSGSKRYVNKSLVFNLRAHNHKQNIYTDIDNAD